MARRPEDFPFSCSQGKIMALVFPLIGEFAMTCPPFRVSVSPSLLTALSLIALVPSCGGEDPKPLGAACVANDDCTTGVCRDFGADGSLCTTACSTAEVCEATGSMVCDTSSGFCAPPCPVRATMGDGVDRLVCYGGMFIACTSLTPIAGCALCGCEPFGGGRCVSSRGCMEPRADGEMCSVGEECSSNNCLDVTHTCGLPRANGEACASGRDCASTFCLDVTHTCGQPHADGDACATARDCVSNLCLATNVCGVPQPMGEPCRTDTECETRNCSTDGDLTTIGHCNMPLLSTCTRSDEPARCSYCAGSAVSFGRMFCLRASCTATAACPSTADRRWNCVESESGGHRCYETCDPASSYWCAIDADYCHSNGYCY